MDWIRPKDIQEQFQAAQALMQVPSRDACATCVRKWVHAPPATTLADPHVFQDAQVLPWLLGQDAPDSVPEPVPVQVPVPTLCVGTQHWLQEIFQHPICDASILRQRQSDLNTVPQFLADGDCPEWTETEPDVLWALSLPSLQHAWPLPLLYPQWFALRWINHIPLVLQCYQLYRIYGAPMLQTLYPLTLLVGPWWYIRTKMGWKLSFRVYLRFILKAARELFKNRTGEWKESLIKITTVVVYVGLYIYGWIQTVDLARMLHQTQCALRARMERIHRFLSLTQRRWLAFEHEGSGHWQAWVPKDLPMHRTLDLPEGIPGMYLLFTSASIREDLQISLRQAYVLQGLGHLHSRLRSGEWSAVRWEPAKLVGGIPRPKVQMIAMGHPALPATQTRNAITLQKNLILTGPNAAGKSTYVRSLLANVLLAQSFGVAYASRASMTPFHTLSTLMRVQDTVGSQSLFEAECRRAYALIQKVQTPHPSLVFFDEPMNATPPTEGAAMAMALVKYVAQFKHVRLMLTTHYHALAELETMDPRRFRNIHMEAQMDPIRFTYRIHPGPSFQSIAIEMLKKDAFPEEVLKDAIEFKNKLCRNESKSS